MGRRALVVLIAVLGLVAGCSSTIPSGFPAPPSESGGPLPTGGVSFQPPFLPIVFKVGLDGSVTVAVAEPKLVTGLGTFSVAGGVVVSRGDGSPLPEKPADTTQLVICKEGGDQACEAYQIGSGRKIRVEMDGRVDGEFEDSRYTLTARPGATIQVIDIGPPTIPTVHGPARIDVETWTFHATSDDTVVDFERSRSGTTPDLQYDHLTGEMSFINGTQVSRVNTFSSWWFPKKPAESLPSELECLQATDWAPQLTPDQMSNSQILACVKTAEGDLGYVYIQPQPDQKPPAYEVYTHVWVR